MAKDAPRRSLIPATIRPAFEWLSRYPLLAGLVLLLLAIVWGKFGVSLGLDHLFWHKDVLTQLLAGFGAAICLGELSFAGYLMDADEDWMNTPKRRSFWWYTSVTWLPLLVLLCAPVKIDFESRWPFLVGAIAGAVVGAGSGLLLKRLTRRDRDDKQLPHNVWKQLPDNASLHRLGMVFFLLLGFIFVVLAGLHFAGFMISPALAICVLFGMIGGVYGFVVFHFPKRHFGVLLAAVAVALAVGMVLPYRHQIAGLGELYKDPRPLVDYDGLAQSVLLDDQPVLLDDQTVLKQWQTKTSEKLALSAGQKPKLVVVAVSGGGLKAAVWTGAVLTAIEEQQPNFPYHVRVVSGASGGMLAAAYYTATLAPPQTGGHAVNGQALPLSELVDDLATDVLTPLVARAVLQDLPLVMLPAGTNDRGTSLEEAWNKSTRGALDVPFHSLAAGEQDGWRPSLVFSPMIVEDGHRLLVSNLDLANLAGGQRRETAIELFRLLPEASQLSVATVARLNATFPYISPASELPTTPPIRIVDAAYYDNYGINLAASWIFEHREWISENTSGVCLLQIRANTPQNALDEQFAENWPQWPRGLWGLTTPAEAALSARDGINEFRNDEQVARLAALFADQFGFFELAEFRLDVDASLSWYLTDDELAGIRGNLDKGTNNAASLANLLDWFKGGKGR